METVNVKKDRLLGALHANRETHQKDFEIAWDAFREKAIANFDQRLKALKQAKRGEKLELYVNLVVPEDHTEDYDRAIEMLDWETGDEVELQQSEFQQLVQDNWGWKQNFTASNIMYTGAASPSKRK